MKSKSNRQSKTDKVISEVATEFVVDIVEEALSTYGISFDKLYDILDNMGYWEIFNDSEVTAVGAHMGTEEILREIGERL